MKTYVYSLLAPNYIDQEVMELPEVQLGHVRVSFLYCGLCGSDMSMFEGRRPIGYPRSLGHEFIATVEEVGADVQGLAPGDLVTSDLNFRCGSCDHCQEDRSHLCRNGQIGDFSNRAFAAQGVINANYLLRIDGDPAPHRCLVEPLSCVLYARSWVDPLPTERVLVVGAGGLGLCLAFALMNDRPPTPFEITDVIEERLEAVAGVAAPVGRGIARPVGEYDAVIDVSGSEHGLRTALEHVRAGGRLCTLSHLDGFGDTGYLLAALTRRDVTFKVSYLNGDRTWMLQADRLLTTHWSPVWDALLQVLPVADIQLAMESRRTSPWCKTVFTITQEAGTG